MTKPPLKACVLVPAYNEARNIGPLVREIRDYCPDVIVIDDGSADETSPVAAAAGATVLPHVRNQGKGMALQTGFDYAREHGYDLAITMDADGQHAPSDIPAFLKAYERTHSPVLVGNRMGDIARMPRLRRFVNRYMSSLLSRLMGQHVPDTQCGFRIYHRAVFPPPPTPPPPNATPPNPKSSCASPSKDAKSAPSPSKPSTAPKKAKSTPSSIPSASTG